MTSIHRLIPLLQPALKLAGCFTIALAAGTYSQDELVREVVGNGVADIAAVKSALDLIKSLGGGEIVGSAKEILEKYQLTINGDFETAFHSAIKKALEKIEDSYINHYKPNGQERSLTEQFFEDLRKTLVSNSVSESDVERFIINRQYFLHHFPNLDKMSGFENFLPEELLVFIEKNFGSVLQHELLQQLKGNSKAQTAYIVSLLDLTARYGAKNAEKLDEMQKCIWELTSSLTSLQVQGNRIVKILMIIQEEQHKQGVDNRVMFQKILDKLRTNNRQPKLYDYKNFRKNNDKSDRYHYRTAYTSFIARSTELDQLHTFILPDPAAKFRWWTITGRGGIGKSRLAQELCLKFNGFGTYYAGFISNEDFLLEKGAFWQVWEPQFHTVIIADYVSVRAQEVQSLIRILTNRMNEFNYSVRLLLLERNIKGPWWEVINTNETRLFRYDENPLEVSPLTDDDRWYIVEEAYRKAKAERLLSDDLIPYQIPGKSETLFELKKLDEHNRPLFAFLAGVALADGKSIRDWKVHNLLTHILNEHERKRWWYQHVTIEDSKDYERLLAMATITHGITLSDWRATSKVITGLPNPNKYDLTVLNRLGDFSKESPFIKPLEPDIMGEFFVADVLSEWTFFDDGVEIAQFISLCWQIAPYQTWDFAERLLLDFRSSNCLPYFWAELPMSINSNVAECWASFQVNITHPDYIPKVSDLTFLNCRYNSLNQLRKRFDLRLHSTFAYYQVSMVGNILVQLGTNDSDLADTYYQDIVELRAIPEYRSDQRIVLRLARNAWYMAKNFAKGNFDKAIKYYNDILVLRTQYEFGSNLEIASQQAKTATIVVASLAATNISEAEYYYKSIKKLRTEHGFDSDPGIAFEQAVIAVALANDKSATGPDQAIISFEDINKLRTEHDFSSNPEIATQQAKAASIVAYQFFKTSPNQAAVYYNKILQLRSQNDFGSNLKIALAQTMTAANFAINLIQSDYKQAMSYYDSIVQLRKEPLIDSDPEIATTQAMAAAILSSSVIKGNFELAIRLYRDVAEIRSKHGLSANPEIALEHSQIAYEIVSTHLGSNYSEQAIKYYQEIVELRKQHQLKSDLKIAFQLAKAARYIIDKMENVSLPLVAACYNDIVQMRTHSELNTDTSIALQQVLAAASLAVGLMASDPSQGLFYYKEIVNLRKDPYFSADFRIAHSHVVTAAGLSIDLIKTNPEQAKAFYQDVVQVRNQHDFGDNPQIASYQALSAAELALNLFGNDPDQSFAYYNDIVELQKYFPRGFEMLKVFDKATIASFMVSMACKLPKTFLSAFSHYRELATILSESNDSKSLRLYAETSRQLVASILIWEGKNWIQAEEVSRMLEEPVNNLMQMFHTTNIVSVKCEYGKTIYLLVNCSSEKYPKKVIDNWKEDISVLLAEYKDYSDPQWQSIILDLGDWLANNA